MKKLLFTSLATLLIVCCGQGGERTVENPEFAVRNSATIEVEKVVLTDTATVLYAGAYFTPNMWVRISSDTYLRAGGEKYGITRAEGIELDAEHFMPASGEDKFVFYFPPLPKGTKSFDFIESDCDDCFKIWGIDLTGNYKPKTSLPKDVAHGTSDNTPLPATRFDIGRTTVKVHVYGMPEDFGMGGVAFYAGTFPTGEKNEVHASEHSGDTYTYTFTQYGPSSGALRIGGQIVTFITAPGETAEIYYDLPARFAGESRHSALSPMTYVGFRGEYAGLNNAKNAPGVEFTAGAYDLAMDPDTWKLDDAAYLQKVKDTYAGNSATIDGMDVPESLKTLYRQDIKVAAIAALSSKRMFYSYSEYTDTGEYPSNRTPIAISADDLEFMRSLSPNDPDIFLAEEFGAVGSAVVHSLTPDQVNYITGSETGLLQDFRISYPVIREADTEEGASPELLATLDGASDPFFRRAYDTMYRNAVEARERAMAEGGFTIVDTPDVAAEKILDAILAGYRGKPVFVDFWATWCGPCLNAMKTIKPLKAEMEEHGVVTIYISNTSSPKSKWTTMLPDIGGIHYYLEAQQWSTLCEKYDIQGIPQYMIFDKQGNKTFQTAGFPGVDNMRKELEKVW